MKPTEMPHTIVETLLAVWLFAMGGAVGSFLNVVVYRLPLGISLVWPGSHCPRCHHAIRWYDNVPMLGWILLRGKCRDCRTRISIRYPAVEAITAALFLAVGATEWCTFGTNLPQRPILVVDGTLFAQLTTGEILGLMAYHLLLLSTLLAAALIQYDGLGVPLRLFWPAALVGFVAPLAWPHLHPVPAWPGLADVLAAPLDGLAGAATGLLLGHASRLVIGPRDRRELPFGLGVAGVFLGWQAILALGFAVAVTHAVIEALRPWRATLTRTSPGIWLFMATTVWILGWESLVQWWSASG